MARTNIRPKAKYSNPKFPNSRLIYSNRGDLDVTANRLDMANPVAPRRIVISKSVVEMADISPITIT